jgi:aspartate-semialdehyde dehydrogenase
MPQSYNIGILGATGLVGQRFISLLSSHPWFIITALAASERSAGKSYAQATDWKLEHPCPLYIQQLSVHTCEIQHFVQANVHIVFSALDANVAGDIEEEFARAGFPVFSNARNHRMDCDVPILIPYVNHEHLEMVHVQRKNRGFKENGFIVTNANCSSTGLAIALKPLQDKFGIKKVIVVTMQAISGAGYPGVSAMDIFDNVIPMIQGEEPKLESEPKKILGKIVENEFVFQDIKISAHCNRVAVLDGHTECVSVELDSEPSIEQIVDVFKSYQSEAQRLKLPSAPENPIFVFDENLNRPQPRLDRGIGGGYTVSVGRIRKCPLLGYKFVILSHNTVIGAAGGSIQNAELAISKGFI